MKDPLGNTVSELHLPEENGRDSKRYSSVPKLGWSKCIRFDYLELSISPKSDYLNETMTNSFLYKIYYFFETRNLLMANFFFFFATAVYINIFLCTKAKISYSPHQNNLFLYNYNSYIHFPIPNNFVWNNPK